MDTRISDGRFDGKVAFITGAGSGIGAAVVKRLVAEGATVVAADVDRVGLEATLAATSNLPGYVQGIELDVSSRDADFAAIAQCVSDHGRLDVLGNVAGILASGYTADVAEATYRRIMAVNVDGPFFLSQAAIPHLLKSEGSIVNIASNAGLQGVAYIVPYSMSKGAVVAFTRSLALELVKTPVRVNAIAPAGTNTNIGNSMDLPDTIDFELVGRMAGYRGMNEPEEVAALFAFVASDEAPGIHGAILRIDRGVTL